MMNNNHVQLTSPQNKFLRHILLFPPLSGFAQQPQPQPQPPF